MSQPADDTDSSGIPPSIRAEAADWLLRRDGGLAESDEQALADWLESDSRRARAFAEISSTWHALDTLQSLKGDAAFVDPDVLLRSGDSVAARKNPSRRLSWAIPALAAAAALAVGIYVFQPVEKPQPEVVAQALSSPLGGMRTVELPDGSIVRLNTDTLVEAAYTDAVRRVQIVRGEAHFKVAPNRERPFIVEAQRVAVRAVGTAFNVWMENDRIEVYVSEGKVSVTAPESSSPEQTTELHVTQGERVIIPLGHAVATTPKPVVTQLPPDEAERVLAWQDRRIEFVATPLAEAIDQFNRYTSHKLSIAPDSPELRDIRFGGTFRPDAQQAFVRLLEAHFDIRAEVRDGETILHHAR
ncbi:MAG TPA: FecR domain-containing protein [Opitutaceae bacterium]|nr:FecR domain-containing protein [Opitutaceae bacterium]